MGSAAGSTTTDENGRSRIGWIDYAKGWCIILVVMMHSTLGVGDALGGEGFLHTIVAWAKPFRMPDFFLVSGLLLARVIDLDWRRFLDRKLVHFLYFFLLWTVLQLLVKKGAVLFASPQSFFGELGFAMIEPFGTLWFIYVLPIMFVLTKLLRRAPSLVVLLAAAGMEIGIRASGWHSESVVIDEFMTRYVYFFAGLLFAPNIFAFARWVAEHRIASAFGLVLWAALECVLAFVPVDGTTMPLAFMPFASLAAGGAGALAVVALSQLLASAGRAGFIAYCGAHSLPIYLGFFLPMAITRLLLLDLGIMDRGMSNVGVKSLIVTIVALIAPLALYRITLGTPLDFLFKRPESLRLRDTAIRSAPQAALSYDGDGTIRNSI